MVSVIKCRLVGMARSFACLAGHISVGKVSQRDLVNSDLLGRVLVLLNSHLRLAW
jgi:hypothetical protein